MTASAWSHGDVLQWATDQALPYSVLSVLRTQKTTGAQLLRLKPDALGIDERSQEALEAALDRLSCNSTSCASLPACKSSKPRRFKKFFHWVMGKRTEVSLSPLEEAVLTQAKDYAGELLVDQNYQFQGEDLHGRLYAYRSYGLRQGWPGTDIEGWRKRWTDTFASACQRSKTQTSEPEPEDITSREQIS